MVIEFAQSMKSRFVFTLLSAFTFGAFAQSTPVLADFDFSKSGYAILVMPLEGGIGARSDTMMSVSYFEQPALLEGIQQKLVVEGPATVYPFACFDDYSILVTRQGKLEKAFVVSTNCHSISTDEDEFKFSGYFPFEGYKIAGRVTQQFEDIAKARATLAHIEKQPNLLYIPEPKWRHFDGKFMIMYDHVKVSHEVQRKEIEDYISKNYPGEKVEIYSWLGSGNSQDGYNFCAELSCKESFYEKFRMDGLTYLPFVKPSSFTLESFWRN